MRTDSTLALTVSKVAVAWVLVLAIAAGAPVLAQPRGLLQIRILAVAPFSDDNPLNRRLADQGAAQLSELLKGGPLQIIDASRVAAELQRQGVTPTDLISPSRTIAVGTALGADAVLTGRVVEIFQEMNRARSIGEFGNSIEGRVAVDVRILEVRTRLKLFEDEMFCGVPALAAVAMDCVARKTASRIKALVPRN